MTEHICIIGGGGQIGRAVAQRFLDGGWSVTSIGRRHPSAPLLHDRLSYEVLDRSDTTQLRAVAGGSAMLFDCLSFDEGDADQLLSLQDSVGAIVAISSASVYADDDGRTLDEAFFGGFPDFGGPIAVGHRTVPPGPETYSTKKVAMEQRLLDGARVPVTILRPCAVHGPHSTHAREWFFVKRLLDGRESIPLAYGGATRFHTSAADLIATAAWHCAVNKTAPVLNVVDQDPLTTRQIGETIMSMMGVRAEIVGLNTEGYPPIAGRNPWALERDMICEPSEDVPVLGSYAELVEPTVRWLVDDVSAHSWKDTLPILASYPMDMFDYEEEDRFLGK